MTENEESSEPKLARCPECGGAFYIKTKEKNKIKTICPICNKEVELELNGADKNGDMGVPYS